MRPLSTLTLPFTLLSLTALIPLALADSPLTFTVRHAWAAPSTADRSLPLLLHDVSPGTLDAASASILGEHVLQWNCRGAEGEARAAWKEGGIGGGDGPDVGDRETLRELARMTSNAYVLPDSSEWVPLGDEWNTTVSFGFEEPNLRGHVFATPDNSTVVVALKGTSATFLGGGGTTAKSDQFNDNLLFSCCCAREDWTWTPVCDCFAAPGSRCAQSCLETAVSEESVYYNLATNLYNNITSLYPTAQIILTGHSLGGALASLLALTFGSPSVSFSAPGDLLPASRLHLPAPPSSPDVVHVYNTADPISMGTCSGVTSACWLAGLAMDARCHAGRAIVFDTVSKLGWRTSILNHRIGVYIDSILDEDRAWGDDEGEVGIPKLEREEDCVDCFKWEYGDWEEMR